MGCLLLRLLMLKAKSSENFQKSWSKWAKFWQFWATGVQRKFWFLLQKALHCVDSHCLTHFAWKLVERSDLQVGWGKNKESHIYQVFPQQPPLTWSLPNLVWGQIFTTWCYTERGYATVYHPSIRTSVRDVQVLFSYWLEFFENNFMAKYLKASARADPNMGDLMQLEHPKIRVE